MVTRTTHATPAERDSLLMRLTPHEASHAMRALIDALPAAHTHPDGRIDFASTPVALLSKVADNAEVTAAGISLSLSAVGNLIPYAAPEMGDGTISSDTIEALGWLMTELGDMAAACFVLATQCRQHCVPGARKLNGASATEVARA
jgi:hypothetical protein